MYINGKSRRSAKLFLMLACAMGSAASATSKVYYVDHSYPWVAIGGDSWKTPHTSLQRAINSAFEAGGGEVWVKAGVYLPEGNERDATFKLKPGVMLYGGFRGGETDREQRNPKINRTVLSGDIGTTGIDSDNSHHVVTAASDCRLDGFVVLGGNANGMAEKGAGGGLYLPANTKNFTAASCSFEKNSASWQGGAVFADGAILTLTNCTFFGNGATGGGGLCTKGDTVLTVQDSVFSANFAKSSGGALELAAGAEAVIAGTSFLSNTTDGNGGAVAAQHKGDASFNLELTDCLFSMNIAQENGGAVYIRGNISPILTRCRFIRNRSPKGAGALGNTFGATVVMAGCTFTDNKGIEGREDIGNDETSQVVDSVEALAQVESAKSGASSVDAARPEPKPKRMLREVYVHHTPDSKSSLRSVVSTNRLTVLVMGDLTDPNFIQNYRVVEAAARDFKQKKVSFFYLYRTLAHPENNGYLQPFNMAERAKQTQLAAELLKTRVPWLFDSMDNQTAGALWGGSKNSIFIYSAEGEEQFADKMDQAPALRKALEEIVGPEESSTSPDALPAPKIKPVDLPRPNLLKRVRFNPAKDPYSPLHIKPSESRVPYYVKLRAEADKALLKDGTGKIYLGFHIDPLYPVEWNNQGEPLKYTLRTPAGVVAPSMNIAPRITEKTTDKEPREFVLNARQLDLTQPLQLQVDYSVYLPALGKSVEISQRYAIQLVIDPFGGAAYRRQIAYEDTPLKEADKPNTTIHPALRKYDSNGDGKLTRNELGGTLWTKFPDIDTNRDGYLNSEEYNAYLRNR